MNKKIILFFFFLSLLSFKNSFATHIVGGEIYYDDLGGGNYHVTLKIYRDCSSPTNADFDFPAFIFVFDAAGNIVDSLPILNAVITTLPPAINNPCFTPPTDVCVEEAIYDTIVNLPPIIGGYNLSYQRCCRNGTILNLIDPGDVGAVYMAHIPEPSQVAVNSSPRFNNFPPIFICSGVPVHFDHSAADPDGDSLYYEFCDPYDGNWTPGCVVYGSNPSCPPPPPPYNFVPFSGGYSGSYPMSSFPAMNINPVTGMLTGTPNSIGQWVVGVCVSEFRNGVLIDINKRDFQFNVVNCPGIPVASIPEQSSFCQGMTVNFSQNSVGASSYLWDFGDPAITTDVSNAFAPSWTYPAPGVYIITLIINPGTLCADTNTVSYSVSPFMNATFATPPGECIESNSFNFTAGGNFVGNGTFAWNFGANANPPISNQQNPTNIVFNAPGTYPVTFTITENGCSDSHTASVQVYPKPIADFGLSSAISCVLNPVQFNDSSISTTPLSYQWDFDNGNTSTAQNPVTTYSAVGVYDVQLIVTNQPGCKDTMELPAPLNVLPPPSASFSYNTNCFNNLINFTQTSTGGSAYSWDFGDTTSTQDSSTLASPSYTYPGGGSYTVTMTVNPGTSCSGTQTTVLNLNTPLIPDFSAPPGECIYNNNFNFTPGGTYMGNGTFSWSFGSHANPSASSLENPVNIVFDTIGSFPVSITITENGCTATENGSVTVYPKPDAFFEVTTPTGCALTPVHFIESSETDTPLTYQWDFGDGSGSTVQNPYVTYADSGSYIVSLEITTQHGCMDTFDYPAPLIVHPSPVSSFTINPDYTSIFAPDVTMTDLSSGATICSADWGDGFITNICSGVHPYTEAGTYILSQIVVNNYGCADTSYSQVIIDDNYLFWLPNAFTPGNIDGMNDTFKPKAIGINNYTFMIFDRWGEKIFETQDPEEGWNGWYKGHLCSNDVYVYRIIFRDNKMNNPHEYIGSVTLVR